MGGSRVFIKCSAGEVFFSKNYVETRKYNIDLQIYTDFTVNRNRSILVRERNHDFRCEKRLGGGGACSPGKIYIYFLDLGNAIQHWGGGSFKSITDVRLQFRLSLHVQQCMEVRKIHFYRFKGGGGGQRIFRSPAK